ncbi:Peptidase M16 inactive domain protein [compost metagenome]
MIGFKDKTTGLTGAELLRQEVTTKLMLDALIGPSSKLYQQLYENDLISDSFGHEYNSSPHYGFSVMGGDTPNPDELLTQIRSAVEAILENGIEPAAFERSKRKKIGGFLRMLNSPEAIASEFTRYRFRESSMFDVLAFYESCTLEEINDRLREHFDFDQLAVSIVKQP